MEKLLEMRLFLEGVLMVMGDVWRKGDGGDGDRNDVGKSDRDRLRVESSCGGVVGDVCTFCSLSSQMRQSSG